MSRRIQVRAYVVGFGDCILLHIPDGTDTRTMLVDFGRAPNDPSSLERFPAIAKDIERQCNGRLDLLVVTHEHLDHMEGFYRERETFNRMEVGQVWMGLPSHPDYYKQHPKARRQQRIRSGLAGFSRQARRNGMTLHPAFQSLLENNLANSDRVEYLRRLGHKPVAYLARERKPGRTVFRDTQFHVLAPEADVSVYYGGNARERALVAALGGADRRDSDESAGFDWTFPDVVRGADEDLGGLSRSDFERLRRQIREDGVAAARFIDRAQNNTSLCLLIESGGKRLLLPGDAELESWRMIRRKCHSHLGPVDFLKVSHHGSHNGTPVDLLDTLLPVHRKDHAQVLVSTKRNVYGTKNPVPDSALMEELRRRCSRLQMTDGRTSTSVDFEI